MKTITITLTDEQLARLLELVEGGAELMDGDLDDDNEIVDAVREAAFVATH